MAKDIFTIKVNGREQDVKMTFGLLNNLCRKVGDIDGAATVMMDQELRDGVLIEILSPRDKNGKITEEIDLNTLEIETESVVELLDWTQGHVLDFFLKALERAKALQDRNLTRIRALMPSSSGTAG